MTRLLPWFILAICVILGTASTIFMRLGGSGLDFFSKNIFALNQKSLLWLLGLFLGWVAGLGYAVSLSKLQVTQASAVYFPLLYISIILSGVFFLNEEISHLKKMGILFIFIGLFFCAKE